MKKLAGLFILMAFIVGCANSTGTQKGAGIGALSGAAIGGIIGHQSGHGWEGAGIGALGGAAAGALIGDKVSQKKVKCPVCGTVYSADVKFCPKDGAELEPIE
ncbi:MAG: YMGG-like glycine zipper-containing protein [Candidatus Gygaella obscura]|nr:YMGG-like glycine zipper-containing protein [Candidatus Gygaella obscura]